jgi:hypothetical protein
VPLCQDSGSPQQQKNDIEQLTCRILKKKKSSLQSIAFSQEHKLVPSGDPSVSSCLLSTPGHGTTYEGVVVVFFHRAADFAGAVNF